jgi:hemolysin III
MPGIPFEIRPDPAGHGDDMTAPMNTEGSRESREQRPLTQLDLDETFPDALADGVEFLGKPRARGWIHVYSAFIAAVAGSALVAVSWSVESTRAGIATLIYTLTIVAMFAVSGTYHRVNWKVTDGAQMDEAP